MPADVFVFDTNAFDHLRSYFPKQFHSFWKHFDALVAVGSVVSTREVRKELDRRPRPDWLEDWLKANSGMFLTPGAAETTFVAEIFKVPHFRILVEQKAILRGTPAADPFVIATARVRGASVVTQESDKPHAAKIPNVCRHFGIPCMNLEGFMEVNGWEY